MIDASFLGGQMRQQKVRNPVLFIGAGDVLGPHLYRRGSIAHRYRVICDAEHIDIIIAVTEDKGVVPVNAGGSLNHFDRTGLTGVLRNQFDVIGLRGRHNKSRRHGCELLIDGVEFRFLIFGDNDAVDDFGAVVKQCRQTKDFDVNRADLGWRCGYGRCAGNN